MLPSTVHLPTGCCFFLPQLHHEFSLAVNFQVFQVLILRSKLLFLKFSIPKSERKMYRYL